ncbi:MAG: DUF222 domain-containing protein [Tessaracoccus sp.]
MKEEDLRSKAHAAGILSSGQKIPTATLRRLLCDAGILPVVLGGNSEILDVGTARRFVTPAIRRALSVRDGGCVFPGCTAADAECDAHHVIPWWQGGHTSLHNLVLACPHHHGHIEPSRTGDDPTSRWQVGFHPQTRKPVLIRPRRPRVELLPQPAFLLPRPHTGRPAHQPQLC